MKIFHTPEGIRRWSLSHRCAGRTVGFVPTMGALHAGHASLMRAAVAQNDVAVLSIYVNPTQFAPHEDFDKYPRTWEADLALAEEIGIHAVYAPRDPDLYPKDFSTWVIVEKVSDGLCGRSRPHFFRGVATIVTKLFHAVLPHRAYFGRKDAQQCAVIRRMVRDLDMGIEIVEMPIVRESDGLALSSRNQYLNPEERIRARALSRGLFSVRDALTAGERDLTTLREIMLDALKDVRIDYVEFVDAETMEPITEIQKRILVAVAAYVGDTRLIDNLAYDPITNTAQ